MRILILIFGLFITISSSGVLINSDFKSGLIEKKDSAAYGFDSFIEASDLGVFNIQKNGLSQSPTSLDKRMDSLNYQHSISIEALGPGIIGSINYDVRLWQYKKLEADIAVGVGGTYLIRLINPWSAFSIPTGINLNYPLTKCFDLSLGVYWVNYFNYWGLIKGTKDCVGALNCPPDYDNFWAPRIGISYHFSHFGIELNCYKYFNFWAYDWFIPSLKIKYHFK